MTFDEATINKIKEFYKPELSGSGYRFNYKDGRFRFLSFRENKRPVYICFDYKAKNVEDALTHGAIEITPQELGKILFPEKWEELKPQIVPDKRMAAYISKIKENIGLIDVDVSGEPIKIDIDTQYKDIWCDLTGSGAVDVGKDKKDRWVAQFSIRTAIDDYAIYSYIYNKKPSRKTIRTTATLKEINSFFSLHGWNKVTFTCWECGRSCHFLDIWDAPSLKERWHMFQDGYCGC